MQLGEPKAAAHQQVELQDSPVLFRGERACTLLAVHGLPRQPDRQTPGLLPENERFGYRHEIYANLREIEEQGLDAWLPGEEEKWLCPKCGKTIVFYHYRCPACRYEPDRKA